RPDGGERERDRRSWDELPHLGTPPTGSLSLHGEGVPRPGATPRRIEVNLLLLSRKDRVSYSSAAADSSRGPARKARTISAIATAMTARAATNHPTLSPVGFTTIAQMTPSRRTSSTRETARGRRIRAVAFG